VLYSLVRVGVFAIALAVLLVVGLDWWLAAILAAVIGLCVAYIFFGKLRDAVALDLADRRGRASTDSDTQVEDLD
jgi:divalent metal cation (Fe/Co/Zn/Cd) transporter